jgi:hypothetical protein
MSPPQYIIICTNMYLSYVDVKQRYLSLSLFTCTVDKNVLMCL